MRFFIGGCAQALYKEARFASEVSREGPAAFYPPRPPFKNLTQVRFFIGGCAQALCKEARFASEVSREGPAAFYPPRPPFKNLTQVRFFIGGCAQSTIQRGANSIHTFCTDKKYDKKLPVQSVIKARISRAFL